MSEATLSPSLPNRLTPVRLLLVEDDPGDAFLVQELLDEGAGDFEVIVVSTIAEARSACGRGIDCSLVDLNLPDATGIDAVRGIVESCPTAAVVVLTGLSDRTLALRAVAAGAQDYLIKDEVNASLLERTVRYALERRRAELTALALAEARLRERHNDRVTRGLLPRLRVTDSDLQLVSRYVPGKTGELLGGDFLDAVQLPDDSIHIVIGDVAGHGPDEAAVGVNLRIAWRALTLAGCDSATVFACLQDMLINDVGIDQLFATIAELTVSPDRRELRVRYAGHPACVLLTDGEVTELEGPRGTVVGIIEDEVPPEWVVGLPHRWRLILFTDGLIEARAGGSGTIWGVEGLLGALDGAMRESPDDLADRLLAEAAAVNGGPLPDDVALLVVARDGS